MITHPLLKTPQNAAPDSETDASLPSPVAAEILSGYGIPFVKETRVHTISGAINAAGALGYPVVLKAVGQGLEHKTEMGLVALNLQNGGQLEKAAQKMQKTARADLEGFQVQPQLPAGREFVVGMRRDPVFGPALMFGLGGIYTEALADVSFRLAPVTPTDIEEMLAEIRAVKLLGPFRGQPAVNRAALINILQGLSRLVAENENVAEIDINPLIIDPDGSPLAVDALMRVHYAPSAAARAAPIPPEAVLELLSPQSIAFIGASATIGKWGHLLPMHTLYGGYTGKVFLVNSKGGRIAGRPVYKRLEDIEAKVDLAVVCIPARFVSGLIDEMAAAGIRYMLLISSGFSETGANGKTREDELMQKARQAGIVILGPNTMGICNPHARLYCTGSPVYPTSGSIMVVAQSGNMGTQLLAFAQNQDIGIRVFAGSGNEGMITIEDYLDAALADAKTRIVMLYLESVKDGPRFFTTARRLSRRKPVIVLKGGRSQAGAVAASSHTGALASDARLFDAACHQAGVITVSHSMDLLDLSAAFASLPLPRGNRVAVMTLGGGWGVVTADLCAAHGIEVPELSPAVLAKIDPLLPEYWSRANPVDLVGESDLELPLKLMEILLQWDGCDAVINLGILGRRIFFDRVLQAISENDPGHSRSFLEESGDMVIDFEKKYIEHIVRLMERYEKPVFGVSLLTEGQEKTVYDTENSPYKAVFYTTPERAVKAFAQMAAYDRHQHRLGGRN